MREILTNVVRVLKSPWTLLILGLLIMVFGLCCFRVCTAFDLDSFGSGVLCGVGFSAFMDALDMLRYGKKDK